MASRRRGASVNRLPVHLKVHTTPEGKYRMEAYAMRLVEALGEQLLRVEVCSIDEGPAQ